MKTFAVLTKLKKGGRECEREGGGERERECFAVGD